MASARPSRDSHPDRASSGIPGLDAVLGGGFPTNRIHLVQGDPGTGLGLNAVRQIVEQHGGTIGIESDEGKGTRVTVRLRISTWISGLRGSTDGGLLSGA